MTEEGPTPSPLDHVPDELREHIRPDVDPGSVTHSARYDVDRNGRYEPGVDETVGGVCLILFLTGRYGLVGTAHRIQFRRGHHG